MESKTTPSQQPDEDIYDILVKWLKEGGASFPDLEFKYYDVDYRGVHAANAIPPNKLIMQIPLKYIMTTEMAKQSDIGRAITESGCVLWSDHSWLASYVLQERSRPDSIFKPFLDILPKHYKNMPIFFEPHELAEMKGSFTVQMLEDRKVQLKREYDNICSYVPGFKRWSYVDFVWARLVVITRVFSIEVNGKETDGLVPMADMLNHKRPNETSWVFDNSRQAFTITSLIPIQQGAQVYDSYGRKCNSRFFVNYGFSLEENEDNQAVFMMEMSPEDPHYSTKGRLLGYGSRRFQIPMDHNEKVTSECFSWLRIRCASSSSEISYITEKPGVSFRNQPPLNLVNEARALIQLRAAGLKSLSAFATTLEQDNQLLSDPVSAAKLTFNIRNAILMRRGEKEVLHYYVNLPAYLSEIISKPIEEIEQISSGTGFFAKDRFGKTYFSTILLPLFRARHTLDPRELTQLRQELSHALVTGPGVPDDEHKAAASSAASSSTPTVVRESSMPLLTRAVSDRATPDLMTTSAAAAAAAAGGSVVVSDALRPRVQSAATEELSASIEQVLGMGSR